MKQLLISLATLVLVVGCSGDSGSARGVGDAFVDAHYVRINLQASKELCSGVAREKVEHEIALTAEIEIEQDTQRPRIYYEIHEERGVGDSVRLIYELSIRAPGLDPYEKFTIVTLRETEGAWTVTNYIEMDSL